MVELDRPKMSSKSSSTVVKQERRDDQEEIDQLAAKMVEANRAKMAGLGSAVPTAAGMPSANNTVGAAQFPRSGQSTLTNYFARAPTNNTANAASSVKSVEITKEKKNVSVDEESAKGRFGWTDSPVHIPYIYRGEAKYCSVRIFEQRTLKTYSNILRPELYSCISVKSYYITELEARLLNEINVKHCDWQFGRELFTVQDLIVKLTDALEFLKFLKTCEEKLVHKSCNPQDRCGFFRIGGESVVPYTMINDIKYVPLFYFEGETGNLDKRAIQITGWDLAYLKLCCKVQGIRNELFANDSYAAVSAEDIRQQFPAQTNLEIYWPSRSLLDTPSSSSSSHSGSSVGSWIKKPSGNPPPLPTPAAPNATSSVIRKNPASAVVTSSSATPAAVIRQPQTTPVTAAPVPPPAPPSLPSHSSAASSSRAPAAANGNSSVMYNGWNSIGAYAVQQLQQENEARSSQAASAQLASVLLSNARAQSALLMPSLSVPMPMNVGLQQQQLNAAAFNMHYAQAALLSMQSRQSVPAPPVTAHSALDSLLRANGIHSESLRSGQGPTTNLINRSPYSTSQSPLTGVVPGSSPHSRSSTGASPRPGLPVPTSSLHSASSSSASSVPKPPPPLIPVNGSYPLFSSMPGMVSPSNSRSNLDSGQLSISSRSSSSQQQQPLQHHHHQPTQHQQQLQAHHQQLLQQQRQQLLQQQQEQHEQQAPFKLQRLTIENQPIPCVNSRQFVYNNLMVALPDMAAYLFPHLGHQACKQVLQDGLGVTLYEANPQQLQVLRSAGKVSSVSSLSGEKIWLVNVRDVVKFMPQIRYMMSRLDGTELSHAHSAKRQRVS